ncbi:MAG: multicopper oxidase domain-containing protein, partial [bacterium]
MADKKDRLSRRDFLKLGGASAAGIAGVAGLQQLATPAGSTPHAPPVQEDHGHDDGLMGAVGQVDHRANGFEPLELLYDFDYGQVREVDGGTVREWTIVAVDKDLEIAPGVFFPAWLYGSQTSAASQRAGQLAAQCPGPTLRCVEGERLRLNFVNGGSHPHTIHFHGIHSAQMDGVPGIGPGMIRPGESFTYEFDALPFGCHLYHCHAIPLKRHIHKGLYGAFIVDPDPERYEGREQEIARTRNHQYPENEEVNEMVMVMNGFDT